MRKFEDGSYIDEEKLLLWLKHVSEIGNKFSGNPLSLESIKMHTKALINLWEHQKLIKPAKTNPNHPRGYGVKMFEGNLETIYHEIKEKQFADTAKNSIQDGYTHKQYIILSM